MPIHLVLKKQLRQLRQIMHQTLTWACHLRGTGPLGTGQRVEPADTANSLNTGTAGMVGTAGLLSKTRPYQVLNCKA